MIGNCKKVNLLKLPWNINAMKVGIAVLAKVVEEYRILCSCHPSIVWENQAMYMTNLVKTMN